MERDLAAVRRLCDAVGVACAFHLPGSEALLGSSGSLSAPDLAEVMAASAPKLRQLPTGRVCVALRQLVSGLEPGQLAAPAATPAFCDAVRAGMGVDHLDASGPLARALSGLLAPESARVVMQLIALLRASVSAAHTPRAIAEQWAPLLGLHGQPAEAALASVLDDCRRKVPSKPRLGHARGVTRRRSLLAGKLLLPARLPAPGPLRTLPASQRPLPTSLPRRSPRRATKPLPATKAEGRDRKSVV